MIITFDEALLRVKCLDATLSEVEEIIPLLEKELLHSEETGNPGIGLAAPQIGIAKNVAIVRVPMKNGIQTINLVNCKIAHGFDKYFFDDEGCLSFPGISKKTLRYKEVHVTDNLVPPFAFVATGLLAVCVQHEMDHWNGILLPDWN